MDNAAKQPDPSGSLPPRVESDTEDQVSPTTVKAPASSDNIFSGFSRGIKKGREDIAKLARQPSQLGLKNFTFRSATPATASSSAAAPAPAPATQQHARTLSLQNSLEKPLPPEPPPTSVYALLPGTPSASNASSNASSSQSQEVSPTETTRRVRPKFERAQTAESMNSVASASSVDLPHMRSFQRAHHGDLSMSSSFTSVSSQQTMEDRERDTAPRSSGSGSQSGPSPSVGRTRTPVIGSSGAAPSSSSYNSQHLAGLMCNVLRTTGKEPHALVGATTTIVGDKLYVFGGRILSRNRPAPLTSDLYELDLIKRHWTKLEPTGDVPRARYFHSMCALGDTKMVLYGGMTPGNDATTPDVEVMSDIHVYEVTTNKWTYIPTPDAPQGRYAHCACILPSSATFSSHKAPLSALQHNPSTGVNEGRIGISIDGTGGAEMVVIGGQDYTNHYIEQISVFNLRSLKWTSTQTLGKQCGAYRSVVCALSPALVAKIGSANGAGTQLRQQENGTSLEHRDPSSSMLIYSNYNFLDVKMEMQIRSSDGTLTDRPVTGPQIPPGLRFPNGEVIDSHFVVSGTYLTSSKQEYALWALDFKSLTWSRIDVGGNIFAQGSWNRGVLWSRRNTYVVLGNRKRSLVEDYNHRRLNFSNMCLVELEAFGFYANPRKAAPMSGFVSASSPYTSPALSIARRAGCTAGGRQHSRASDELGEKALMLRELSDMDILCIGGERIPVNSRIVARRWGPYFVQLLREGTATQDGNDTATLRSGSSMRQNSVTTLGQGSISSMRQNSVTSLAQSSGSSMRQNSVTALTQTTSRSTMDSSMSMANSMASTAATSMSGISTNNLMLMDPATLNTAPTPRTLPPSSRPRCLYLPHTFLTVQTLVYFLYTSSLPPPTSPLSSPQILCSLMQIARPYRIDGLLEAVVERLHVLLDSRNAAAIFNGTAMAAGGGRGIDGSLNPNYFVPSPGISSLEPQSPTDQSGGGRTAADGQGLGLRLNTAAGQAAQQVQRPGSGEVSAAASVASSEWSSEVGGSDRGAIREPWGGELNGLIGLQKRGLRGLMDGRRLRERAWTSSRQRSGSASADRERERERSRSNTTAMDRERSGSVAGLGGGRAGLGLGIASGNGNGGAI